MDEIACFADPGGEFLPPSLASLPDFYLEDNGLDFTDPATLGDALWNLPNTFPMIRVDPRYFANADGSKSYVGGSLSAADFGVSIGNRHQYIWNNLGYNWPAGKPYKWALILAGVDEPDCSTKLVRHASDAIAGIDIASYASMYAANGIAQSLAYFTAAFASAAEILSLVGYNFTLPSRLFVDLEKEGDQQGIAHTLWPAALADPRASSAAAFDNVQSLNAWAASHATALGGGAIPAYNAGLYDAAYNPGNWDYAHRSSAAVRRTFFRALEAGIYAPFRAAFGNLPCGNWLSTTSSRTGPVLERPLQYSYQHDGYTGGGAHPQTLCPAMYDAPPVYRDPDAGRDADSPSWETANNYELVYGSQGSDVDRLPRLGRLVGRDIVQQLHAAAPGSPIVPSLTQNYVGRTGAGDLVKNAIPQKALCAPVLAGYCADCFQRGAEAFWLFEPNWGTWAEDRNCVASFVAQANARITARNYAL